MKRKTKYFMAIAASFCIVFVSGCSNDSIKIKNGQRFVYGEVEKIVGNEIILSRSYEKGNEIEKKDDADAKSESTDSISTDASETLVQQESSSLESSSELESSEAASSIEGEDTVSLDAANGVEVVVSLQIPVGIPIHKENQEISFKDIKEGDPLKIVLEKDKTGIEVPVEAWVEQLTEKEKKNLEKQKETEAVVTGAEETSSDTPASTEDLSSDVSEPLHTEGGSLAPSADSSQQTDPSSSGNSIE